MAFPQQQWLRERASLLRYTYIVLSCRRRQTGSAAHPCCYVLGTGVCSGGYCGRGVSSTHIHLVPRSRMGGAVPLLLHWPSCRVRGQLTF